MIHCPSCGAEWTPKVHPLTRKQLALAAFLQEFINVNGYAPSFDQIAAHFGLKSLASVHEQLTNLERKGIITRRFNEARSIVMVVRCEDLGDPRAARPT
jgi:SOS-response transcriptional repressor LexA